MSKAELIVAMDVPNAEAMEEKLRQMPDFIEWYKVGLELYCAEGPAALEPLKKRNKKIFLEMVENFHQSKHKSGIDYSGYRISNDQVDVLFAVLDLDGNGQLDYDEIIGVLQERN